MFERHESVRASRIQELRLRIDEGLAELDRGERVDGERFMQGMLDELEADEAKSKAG